jgi:hypothetical protein
LGDQALQFDARPNRHNKKPRLGGVFEVKPKGSLLGAGTDHFDLDAAVLHLAFLRLVVSHRLLLALAFGVDAVLLDALAGQVGFLTASARLTDSFWL